MKPEDVRALKEFGLGREAGINEGTLKEAEASLFRRFTDREIDAFLGLYWRSDMMKSIRVQIMGLADSIVELRDEVSKLKSKKTKKQKKEQ